MTQKMYEVAKAVIIRLDHIDHPNTLTVSIFSPGIYEIHRIK